MYEEVSATEQHTLEVYEASQEQAGGREAKAVQQQSPKYQSCSKLRQQPPQPFRERRRPRMVGYKLQE